VRFRKHVIGTRKIYICSQNSCENQQPEYFCSDHEIGVEIFSYEALALTLHLAQSSVFN
jgi:hypothetical protein